MDLWLIISGLLLLIIPAGIYERYKKVEPKLEGKLRSYQVRALDVHFLADLTWKNSKGVKIKQQQIFKATIDLINKAQHYLLFDVFLFNHHNLKRKKGELISKTELILAELNQKTIPKYWITDPVNTFYGADLSEPLVDLQASKVNLVLVNIHKLRANNLLFAPFWLLIFQFFPKKNPGILPHPLKPKRKSGLRPFFEAVNAKANHRKVFLGDDKVIVGSANLHDASSFYANTALEVQSLEVAQHFFTSEKAVAKISGLNIPVPDLFSNNSKPAALKNGDHVAVTPLLGKQILASILEDLRSTQKGDQIFIAMLFIAHRKVIKELKKATKRGVVVKVVLDSNQHSFGENKIGMPNQFVARELVKSKIAVYFYQTGDWEFHSKLIFIIKNSTAIINTGSANLTRRSLSATNLEANLRVEGNLNLPIFQEVQEYFDQKLKKPLAQKQETAKSYHFSFFYWLYRFEEATGLATF